MAKTIICNTTRVIKSEGGGGGTGGESTPNTSIEYNKVTGKISVTDKEGTKTSTNTILLDTITSSTGEKLDTMLDTKMPIDATGEDIPLSKDNPISITNKILAISGQTRGLIGRVETVEELDSLTTNYLENGAPFSEELEINDLFNGDQMMVGKLGDQTITYIWSSLLKEWLIYIVSGYDRAIINANPIGSIVPFMGTEAPKNHLICDGSAYDIADYQELAEMLAQLPLETRLKWNNEVDWITTFSVPDMRGLFMRMVGGASDEIGVKQEGTEHPNIGNYSGATAGIYVPNSNTKGVVQKYDRAFNPENLRYSTTTGTSGILTPTTFTSRPDNMAVLYCIKYSMGDDVTINGIGINSKGDFEVSANAIPTTIPKNETEMANTDEVLNFAVKNMTTHDQLKFSSLLDNSISYDLDVPQFAYLDVDGFIKGVPFKLKGTQDIEKATVLNSEVQLVQCETVNYNIIKFAPNEDIAPTEGTQFTPLENGIRINNLDNEFNMTAVIGYSFINLWLSYPITLEFDLFVNGVPANLVKKVIVTKQSAGTAKVTNFTSNDIVGLKAGDILTIGVRCYDSSGNLGDGSWTNFTIYTNSNFSCYYRDVNDNGYGFDPSEIFADASIILKTDNNLVPNGTIGTNSFGIISFTDSSLATNSKEITFDSTKNAYLFNIPKPKAYNIISLLTVKNVSTSENGLVNIILILEYLDESGNWVQQIGTANPISYTVNAKSQETLTFNNIVDLPNSGQYRLRLVWLNTTNAEVYHQPTVNQSITVGADNESFTISQVGSLMIRETIVT